MWFLKSIRYLLIYLILFMGIFLFNTKVIQLSFVPTQSMEPTIQANSLLINSRWDADQINRNDVVTLRYNDLILVKRVIGIPGDEIEIKNGAVYVNGNLEDDYFKIQEKTKGEGTYLVPKNSYFVMGDNRTHSTDSRDFGFIKNEDVIAKCRFVLPAFHKV